MIRVAALCFVAAGIAFATGNQAQLEMCGAAAGFIAVLVTLMQAV